MERVLLAYDGSDGAKRALARAAELASAGASVTVVTAVSARHPGGGRSSGAVDPEEMAERNRELEEAEKMLSARGVTVETIEVLGDPADGIVEAAQNAGADLIIVGTRGQSRGKRMLVGSVSTGVLHKAGCDVLVVR